MTDDEGLFTIPAAEPAAWPDRPRLLLSYAYAANRTVEFFDQHLAGADMIVDSGAFTVFTSRTGKTIQHDEYLEWLIDHAKHIRFAFTLDVIGDPDASMANYLYAQDQIGDRVHLIPTWHFTEPESVFDAYCRLTDYIAIGGAVPFSSAPRHLTRICRHLHEVAADRGVRLHGLGITTSSIVMHLPWTSVDSASWVAFGLFGRLTLADKQGRIRSQATGEPLDPVLARLTHHYGLDPSRMHEDGYGILGKGWGTQEECKTLRGVTMQAGARAFMYQEAVKRRRHPNFRLYLSSGVGRHDWVTDQIFIAHSLGSPYPMEIPA